MPSITLSEALPQPVEVSDAERVALLDVARSALVAAVRGVPRTAVGGAAAVLGDRRGSAFVTLTEGGELRGCVGIVDPSWPLADSVAEAAFGAALRDGRFPPVVARELPAIEIDVSVLGPLVPLRDPLSFRPGIDGLVVLRGFAQGLLLPEVATMHDLGTTAMLDATCRKAGLPPGAWRDPRTRIMTFRTVRFGGPALA